MGGSSLRAGLDASLLSFNVSYKTAVLAHRLTKCDVVTDRGAESGEDADRPEYLVQAGVWDNAEFVSGDSGGAEEQVSHREDKTAGL